MLRQFHYGIAFLLLLVTSHSFGTHLRGGQITLRLLDCTSNTYEITLTLYTNTQAGVTPGGGTLNFGDGSSVVVPQLTSAIIDDTFSVGQAVYKIDHQFPSKSGFTISYGEQNRNAGIINIQNSVETLFYLESFIMANSACDQPMTFTIPP